MGQLVEFANGHPLLALAVVISLLGVIAYELKLKADGVTNVSAVAAVRLINNGAAIVDVRAADEFSAGHIVNARNIPLAEIQKDPDAIKKPKNKLLLTICNNGMVSGKAANTLRKAGFESVFSLKGGLAAWRAENLPVVS